MKNTSAKCLTAIALFLLQISFLYAQKGTPIENCIENQPNEYCVEFEPRKYNGYYQILDPKDPINSKKRFYQNNKTLKLKVNDAYNLVIGEEGNILPFTVKDDGNITISNNTALDVSMNKKIKFNTVEIFMDPLNYEGNAYLSIYYAQDLFYGNGDAWCPLSKNQTTVSDTNQAVKNCPANRKPTDAIHLVPNLKYFFEISAKGYNDAITFKVDRASNGSGVVSETNNPRAVKLKDNSIQFNNLKIKVISPDFKGVLMFGARKENIPSSSIVLVPYVAIPVALLDTSVNPVLFPQQRILRAQYFVMPEEMTFTYPGNSMTVKIKFERVDR